MNTKNRLMLSITSLFLGVVSTSNVSAQGISPESVFLNEIIAAGKKAVSQMNIGIAEMGDSQTVTIKNAVDERRKFYWTAAGCAGIADGVTFVCKSAEVGANGEAEYTFKKGTSQRKLQAKRVDKKDKECDPKVDINTTNTAQDQYLIVDCNKASTPPVQQMYPEVNLVIRSARATPVTVIVGWESCTGTYQKFSNVCKTVQIPANGYSSVSYAIPKPSQYMPPSKAKSGGNNPRPVATLGVIMWTDGKNSSNSVGIASGNITIPAIGNTILTQ